jgi:potassium channel
MTCRVATFASVNRLPPGLKEQMMVSAQLKFNAAEVLQHQLLSDLPRALRSEIALHLFRETVERCYLFQGVSSGLVLQLVRSLDTLSYLCQLITVCCNSGDTGCRFQRCT